MATWHHYTVTHNDSPPDCFHCTSQRNMITVNDAKWLHVVGPRDNYNEWLFEDNVQRLGKSILLGKARSQQAHHETRTASNGYSYLQY